MSLAMTSEEICRHYRLAANKSEDIVVLADLNMTSRDVIREILERDGEMVAPKKKTSRVYGTTRGPEIEKRLRKGQSIEHIARNMDIKRETVEKWIRENGMEAMVSKRTDDPVSKEEEERRGKEKRKRLAWEMKKARREREEAERKVEEETKRAEKAACAKIRMEDRPLMERIEAVIDAVPESAEQDTRVKTYDLCRALVCEWLVKRLGLN